MMAIVSSDGKMAVRKGLEFRNSKYEGSEVLDIFPIFIR